MPTETPTQTILFLPWALHPGAVPTNRSKLRSRPIVAQRSDWGNRGIFKNRKAMKFRDVLDGLSNTIMCAEIPTDLGDRRVKSNASFGNGWGGGGDFDAGILPPGSYHQGGCHVLMGDGAVIFMSDSVEAGNSRAGSVMAPANRAAPRTPGSKSPFGLWGALGTRSSGETIEEQLNQ